jgi:hypothetical protein
MDANASVLLHFMVMTLFAVQVKPNIFFIMPPIYHQFPAASSQFLSICLLHDLFLSKMEHGAENLFA